MFFIDDVYAPIISTLNWLWRIIIIIKRYSSLSCYPPYFDFIFLQVIKIDKR